MKMNKSLIAVLTVLLTAGCGKDTSYQEVDLIASNMVGATAVKGLTNFSRHTVGLSNQANKTLCTGSIIEPDLILTAAHCLEQATKEKIQVHFGDSTYQPTETIAAKNILTHESYNSVKVTNDLALIRLKKNVPAGYKALDLEDTRQVVLAKGDIVTALGYGVSKAGMLPAGKGTLRMAPIPFSEYTPMMIQLVLDQTGGKGICFGDSGGPSFILVNGKAVLVGIASFLSDSTGKRFSDCKTQSILTNPNAFYSWIQRSKLKI